MAAGPHQQSVVVMRHGDRLDHADPSWPSRNPRPWDPSLSDAGLLRAWTVGKRIRADGWAIHRVLVSPFPAMPRRALCSPRRRRPPRHRRPVQRASRHLTPQGLNRIRIVGDDEHTCNGGIVGKVAPSVKKWFPDLPELEAVLPSGTIDHYAESHYPEVPKWDESVLEARSRYASVVKALADKYPDENLLLVTHGEGVGASVSYFETGLEVYEVEYCAYSVLGRQVTVKPGGGFFTADGFKVLTKSGTTGIQYAPVSAWPVG